MKRIQDYSAQEILEILNDSDECNWLEAKGSEDVCQDSGKENFRTLQETVCSFCNEPGLGGGVIVYGFAENRDEHSARYQVEGIPNPDKAQLDIATQCKNLFNIAVYPQIKVEKIDDKKVLLIYVPELPERQKPLYFKKDGLPRGAFRRIGSADLRCTEHDLRDFYADSASGYDQVPVPGATIRDIAPEAIKRYRVLRERVNPAAEELLYDDQELLESLGCVSVENKEQLNLAGVLLFGSSKLQRRVIPSTRIDYIRVPGNEWVQDPEVSFESIDMLGPLLLTLYRVIDAVSADLPKGFLLPEGAIQADSTGLPIRVLREAIVNAMMHRSYREEQPTQIIRYGNRIEIKNAGYSLKGTDELGTPGSKIRNKILAPVFHDTNLAETKGSGIKRMRELMKKAHLAQPTFESSRERNEFTIRLLLHHFLSPGDIAWLMGFAQDKLNDAQKTALIFVREVGAIDNSTYRQMSHCDTLKASSDLRKLRDKGFLIQKGKGSASYYLPAQKLVPSETPQAGSETPQAWPETPQAGPETPQAGPETPQAGSETPHVAPNTSYVSIEDLPDDLQNELNQLKKRVLREEMNDLILRLCAIRPLTRKNLARLIGREESNLRPKLKSLIESNCLCYLYPEMPNHPNQAYMTCKLP